jgi:hypothetical protein
MLVLHVVSILLVMNMFILHADKLVLFYKWAYTKIWKPRFQLGEGVMVDGTPYIVINMLRHARPYTYLCVLEFPTKFADFSIVIHESKIKKKTGLLKELE